MGFLAKRDSKKSMLHARHAKLVYRGGLSIVEKQWQQFIIREPTGCRKQTERQICKHLLYTRRGLRAGLYKSVIARSTATRGDPQAQDGQAKMDCFSSLAMTGSDSGLLLCARNDGFGLIRRFLSAARLGLRRLAYKF